MTTDVDRISDELAQWLPAQRWFAGKNRPVHSTRLLTSTTVADGDARLLHAIIEVEHDDGGTDRYQVLLGLREDLPDNLAHGSIGSVDGRLLYDAVYDSELTGQLLDLMANGARIGQLSFDSFPDADLSAPHRPRVLSGEQSNTSLVFGNHYILKLFRRLQPGLSPDVELHEALHRVGCEHLARPYGSITGELDGQPTTLAMLGEFLPNAADGWSMAIASVRDLMAEADLHAHEVGGDFAAEARRLGHAVATVHADLRRALGSTDSGPGYLADVVAGMHERLDAMVHLVPELEPYDSGVRAVFDRAAGSDLPVQLQRIHGDLHLGQVLRTPRHWVLIDFEGEPAVPLARRREPASPLRDVAGMLRSFDYAAHQMLVGHGELADHADRQHLFRAQEWSERNCESFCDGYAEVMDDPRDETALLQAYELDKAVYEVGYEAAHRPNWLPIPLMAIERQVGG